MGDFMIKYGINGKELSQREQDFFCPKCRNGDIFLSKPRQIKTDSLSSNYNEYNCVECNSVYRIERIIPELEIETETGVTIYENELENFDYDQTINKKNKIYFALLIDKEFREAKNKMMFEHPEAILKAKDEYMRTGKCKKHIWIESHPIKTSEGEFIIKNCLICKLAYVNYKNKRIKGKMFELVNFLAMRNIHNLEKEKKKTQIFSMKNIIK